MARAQVRIDLAGINAVMKSAEVQALIDDAGQAMLSRLPAGKYEYVPTGSRPHRWVARGYVQTASIEGARDNARSNSLLKAMG